MARGQNSLSLPSKMVRVVRVGMDRDHVIDGEEVCSAVALNRQMPGKAPRRTARTAKRTIAAMTKFGISSVPPSGPACATRSVVAISGTVLTAGALPVRLRDAGDAERDESGNSNNRKIPEMQNATTATTIARRSRRQRRRAERRGEG